MHTLHWWAVKAEDKQEAFDIVQSRLINEDGTHFVDWSDWHVVGGGRWSDSQYEDSSDMIISYADTPDKFKETLEGCRKARINEMQECMSKINTDKFISNMDDYISNNASLGDKRFDMNEYYIKIASNLMSEYYTSHSYFYDLIEYTASMDYIQQELDSEDSKMLFLVPIDFHF